MMAGQIEEPITFNFQADSVHSGSISFGRFAHEPLLWERRSSFSHNRIQEEVARCSKHRIVTEKKAYFEAQFKKKALLRQCSLDAQTGVQFETNDTEAPDTRSRKEDYGFVQEYKNDASSDTSVCIGYREDYDYVQEARVDVHFDESSGGSNDLDEQGMMDNHVEGREILIAEPLKLPSSDSAEVTTKVDAARVTAIDTQTVIDCAYSRCNSAEHDVEVQQNIDTYTCFVEEECQAIDLYAGSQKAEKEVSHLGEVYPKIMVSTETSGTKSNVKVTRTQRDSLCEAAKVSSRNLTKMGKQSAIEPKTFKQSKIVPSAANKLTRFTNPEHLLTRSANSISKTLSSHKSACKEKRVIKVTRYPVTSVMKDAKTTHQSPNRTEKVIAPKTPKNSGLKTCPTTFRLRGDVRAEKKKETFSSVEQTSHIQKAEINRSHAKAQDKTPDEINRRGLNIKAKPMPAIHNKDERIEAKRKDVIANRPQTNPSHPRTKVVAGSSTNLKSENVRSNTPSHASTITSHSGKKTTKTSAVSSLMNKSTHPPSMRNVVSAKGMAGNDKVAKLKNQTVPPKVEAVRGRGTIGVSQSISERTKKCTVRKVAEKPRLQEMSRTAARVC